MRVKTRWAFVTLVSVFLAGARVVPADDAPDRRADALVKQAASAATKAQTLTAEMIHTMEFSGRRTVSKTRAWLKAPNLARVESDDFAEVSDGKARWWLSRKTTEYGEEPASPHGLNIAPGQWPIDLFFSQWLLNPNTLSGSSLRYAGTDVLDGVRYEVVVAPIGRDGSTTFTLYFAPDRLIHRVVLRIERGGEASRQEWYFTDVRIGQPIPASEFRFQPPAAARPYYSNPVDPPDEPGRMLRVGTQAPDFRLTSLAGRPVTLQEALNGKQALLVTFWMVDDGPCRDEMSRLQEIVNGPGTERLGIIAIDCGDSRDEVRRFLSANGITLEAALNGQASIKSLGVWEHYDPMGCPANYLLDSSGKVVYRAVGFNEPDLRAAMNRLGIQ